MRKRSCETCAAYKLKAEQPRLNHDPASAAWDRAGNPSDAAAVTVPGGRGQAMLAQASLPLDRLALGALILKLLWANLRSKA